jgi:hypothetical protein
LTLPGEIDSNNPLVWSLADGVPELVLLTSWGGVPVRSTGADLERLQRGVPVSFTSHPGHGMWIESVVADDVGVWYGYYHHERPADECGRPDRQLPRIGAARSDDQGRTWSDLGIVIDAPAASNVCDSSNRFVLGGVGDVSAMLDEDRQSLYLYFSQYGRQAEFQGVTAARLAWADRDAPAGKVTIWNAGAWLPASPVQPDDNAELPAGWEYPAGSPLVRARQPFHDGANGADVYWGPSLHWNTQLERYVMLLNRSSDENFDQEGIYVSMSTSLDESTWSPPAKIFDGGQWYPQVIGLEAGVGTDKLAAGLSRFFMSGRSEHLIRIAEVASGR